MPRLTRAVPVSGSAQSLSPWLDTWTLPPGTGTYASAVDTGKPAWWRAAWLRLLHGMSSRPGDGRRLSRIGVIPRGASLRVRPSPAIRRRPCRRTRAACALPARRSTRARGRRRASTVRPGQVVVELAGDEHLLRGRLHLVDELGGARRRRRSSLRKSGSPRVARSARVRSDSARSRSAGPACRARRTASASSRRRRRVEQAGGGELGGRRGAPDQGQVERGAGRLHPVVQPVEAAGPPGDVEAPQHDGQHGQHDDRPGHRAPHFLLLSRREDAAGRRFGDSGRSPSRGPRYPHHGPGRGVTGRCRPWCGRGRPSRRRSARSCATVPQS